MRVPEVLARFSGARTAKVKVAEPGQSLAEAEARLEAVRAALQGRDPGEAEQAVPQVAADCLSGAAWNHRAGHVDHSNLR